MVLGEWMMRRWSIHIFENAFIASCGRYKIFFFIILGKEFFNKKVFYDSVYIFTPQNGMGDQGQIYFVWERLGCLILTLLTYLS